MPCGICGSDNMVLIVDEEIYDENDVEVETFMCGDCWKNQFGSGPELDDRIYV
jgi:hypothetical protein